MDIHNAERIEAIEKECLSDIWLDFNEEHGHILEELNEVQQEWMRERILSNIHRLTVSSSL